MGVYRAISRKTGERCAESASKGGFILPAALIVVLLLTLLVAGAFLATTQETRIGASFLARNKALLAAESAIESTISGWSGGTPQPVGVLGEKISTLQLASFAITVSVIRLDSTVYWITAQSKSLSGVAATRRIGALARAVVTDGHTIAIERIPGRWWSELF